MKARSNLIVAVGVVMASCVSKENHFSQNDGISGAYAREYSFKVVNPESGNEIGIATVRDTILIQHQDKNYAVVNHKWRLNDYDRKGWQNMEHADDRPISNYSAVFQPGDSTLVAESFPILYLDALHSVVYMGQKGSNPYRLVKTGQR